LYNFKPDLVFQEARVLESVFVKDEEVRECGEEKVRECAKKPRLVSSFAS
jgi:hypothetical protein